MPTPLYKLAELVNGTVTGDGNTLIHAAKPLNECRTGDISFIEDAKYLERLQTEQLSAVVCPTTLALDGIPVIHVDDPLDAFVAIVQHFRGEGHAQTAGVDPRAHVHLSAEIGCDTSVGPFSFVGAQTTIGARCVIHNNVSIGSNCVLGDDVVLYPGVVLTDGTRLGNRATVHPNAVIGADGFGYRLKDGKHCKVPQLGNVEIGDDVEIGACTTIDRGTFKPTRIGNGTKIDNLVQVAHNCQIGRHNLLISQVGIAGSCSTGEYVVIAGQVGIADHINIGDGAIIGAKAGVTKDVAPQSRMLGAPATPEREQKKILMSLEKLPEIRRDIKRLKQQVGSVEENAA